MPVVRISDATFTDLGTIARWHKLKTPGDAIELAVRELMESLGIERDDAADSATIRPGTDVLQFDDTPGLSFTKPTKVSVDGVTIQKPRWATILLSVVGRLKDKGLTGEKLRAELGVPSKGGCYEEEGFRYYPHLGISVQGQAAQDAWKEVERLANKWRIPVSVEFEWRQNPKAQYPGKKGHISAG